MNKAAERLFNGVVKENPTFVLILGMCPTLAVTTSAVNGAGMGLATTAVLIMSNLMIAMLRKIIPDQVRMPSFIVIVASFVTIVQFLMEGFVPTLYKSLGIYIPLIVVNCIILGRAEAYASKNDVISSIFDGIGMGLGFTIGLTALGAVRELIGTGTVFAGLDQLLGTAVSFEGFSLPSFYEPFSIMIMAPGAFFVLAILIAIQNKVKLSRAKKAGEPADGCMEFDCASCGRHSCSGRKYTAKAQDIEADKKEEQA